MHLEEALDRIQEIVGEIENKQLPLHEIIKLHEEGQKLIGHSQELLVEARNRLNLTEVEVDSSANSTDSATPQESENSDLGEIDLF